LKQGRGRYLYPDSLFPNQEAAKNDAAGRIVQAGDLEVDGRTINAGFVKLSEEEMEKRHKEGACFKCNKKGHYSRDCQIARSFSIRMDTGRTPVTEDQIWYRSGE